jgi:hypothetical protein
MALDFLKIELRQEAPRSITPLATFDEHPLDNEGCMTVFGFKARVGGGPEEAYCIVAGQTVTNYYPQWDLDAEDIYCLHLGTRFMLVVEVQQIPIEELPATLEQEVREQMETVAPGEVLTDFQPVAAFAAETQKHAVCRAKIADEDVYVLAADLPLGICRETHLPPHVVYRRHIGRIVRMEEDAPD